MQNKIDNADADRMDGPFDAAIGIKNGLMYGGAFWIFTYLVFSLVSLLA